MLLNRMDPANGSTENLAQPGRMERFLGICPGSPSKRPKSGTGGVLYCITSLLLYFDSRVTVAFPAVLLRLPSPPHNGKEEEGYEESCSCGTSPQEGHEGDEGKEGIKVNASAEGQRSVSVLDHCIRHGLAL